MPQTLRLPRPRCGLAMTRNWNVFIWKTDVFCFMRSFFARYCSASSFKRSFRKLLRFQSFRSGNCSVFPQNPPDLSLRGGRIFAPDAAIFDGTICHPGTNYGCAKRNRTINKERGSRMKQGIHVFCDRGFFLLRAPVLRCGIPCLKL